MLYADLINAIQGLAVILLLDYKLLYVWPTALDGLCAVRLRDGRALFGYFLITFDPP